MERLDDAAHAAWCRRTTSALAAMAAFGAALVALPQTTAAFFDWMILGSTAPHPGYGPDGYPYLRLVYAVLGATIVGWSVALLAIARGPLRRREPWAWHAIALSAAAWFVPDTVVSLWTGHWPNAVLNAGFALALGIPLAGLRGAFSRRATAAA